MVKKSIFGKFFKNNSVLIIVHTGFIGSWLAIWLNDLGSNVIYDKILGM